MFNLSINYVGTKSRVEVRGDCLKHEKISFDHGKVVNIYIVYKINENPIKGENYLFGAVKIRKHVDIDPYKYSGFGIGFYRKGFFQLVMKLVEM